MRAISLSGNLLDRSGRIYLNDQLFDQRYITFDAGGALVLSDECPPIISIQWGSACAAARDRGQWREQSETP